MMSSFFQIVLFLLANCVIYAFFGSMKLFESLVSGNSTFFCEIMKFLFEFFLIKTHKTPWPLWRGGIFSHFAVEVLGLQ